jgi:hypothetical protein
MDDLVKLLREELRGECHEAADTIERLTAEKAAAEAEIDGLRTKAQTYAELLLEAAVELEAHHSGSGFSATIRAALKETSHDQD